MEHWLVNFVRRPSGTLVSYGCKETKWNIGWLRLTCKETEWNIGWLQL